VRKLLGTHNLLEAGTELLKLASKWSWLFDINPSWNACFKVL